MGILAVYDTIGIQNYIFASNKLAENVGGSKLVADAFDKILPIVICEVTGQTDTDWRKGGGLNPILKSEIIYQGGGNAFVAFCDESIFQDVTKRFLACVCKIAPGVGIAVAAIETDFENTYKSDFEKLGKRLSVVKGGFNMPSFAGNQPITKQSSRTGMPVSKHQHGEYLSTSQVKKRERYDKHKEEYESEIESFSDLAFDRGTDSLIAIIHADGNNMGNHIKSHMMNYESYSEAVPKIRELSDKINKCYKKALCRTINAFNRAYKEFIEQQKRSFPAKAFRVEPPILELISDGDDITLVIGGRFAIDFAARLLREIELTPEDERPFIEGVPTACAGVVLFHNHYPFSEAYKLAEELCSNAKKPSREHDGSYIDFHLHQSGNVSGLHQLRERQYVINNKTLLRRPWKVTGEQSESIPDFKWFESNILVFKDTEKMPRNKTKALRNAIGSGETEADIAISQMRDRKIPELPQPAAPESMSKYAPYYDVLEFYDAYENLLNKEVQSNA